MAAFSVEDDPATILVRKRAELSRFVDNVLDRASGDRRRPGRDMRGSVDEERERPLARGGPK